MKGLVFTEFLDLVEEQFGLKVKDKMLTDLSLPSGGSYTAIGTYSHKEILKMVTKLSELVGVEVSSLVKIFGKHLFTRFEKLYPQYFEGIDSSFEFLESIESKIHVEVKKLYPDAELPTFDSKRIPGGQFELIYKSKRPFSQLALGLIEGCLDYYKDSKVIETKVLSEQAPYQTRFRLQTLDERGI